MSVSVERWLPVVGYEGLYSVSSAGRVRSHLRSGRILKPALDDAGYPAVNLCRDGVVWHVKVHRLVSAAFHGPCPDGLEVRHLDGNPGNPAADNLAYGTRSENMRDKRDHGTNHQVNKIHCPKGHAYDERNTYIYPSNGRRSCRICANQAAKNYKARKAARAAAVA